jgi:hypothetical protein
MNRSLAVLVAGVVFCAVATAQTLSLVNATVEAPPTGRINVVVKAAGLKIEAVKDGSISKSKLTVTDVTNNNRAIFTQAVGSEYIGGSGQTAYWQTTWQIAGLRPGGIETRLLKLQLDKVVEIAQLTIHGPTDLQVSLSGPGFALRLNRSRCAPILVASNGLLTKVEPIQSTLVDDKTGQSIPQSSLSLVDSAGSSSNSTNGLSIKNPNQPLCLQVSDNFFEAGKFDGNVKLGSQEKPDLGTFHLAVYFTSLNHRLWGMLCLFLGLITYFVIAVWTKARSRWVLALLPAARLREELSQLLLVTKDAESKTSYNFPVLLATTASPGSLNNLLNQLSRQNLAKNGLPWKFAIPFAVPDLSMQYQQFLLSIGNQASSLGLIVRWGLTNVVTLWPKVVELRLQQTAGNAALQTLDQLAIGAGPPGQLTTQIQQALATLQAAMQNAQAALGGQPGGAPTVTYGIPGSQQLTIQLERLSVFAWILWAILTVGVGACVLVVFNDGFGTTQDLIQCFLWGAGMPAVGQGFGGLSAGSVTSAFALQVAR